MHALCPHVARAGARVQSITPLPAGGYAVLTTAAIELLDATLARTRTIPGDFGTPVPLADGRFVATASLDVFAPDWSRTRLDGLGRWVRRLVPTADGFFAVGEAALLVDRAGARRLLAIDADRFDSGVAARRDGLALAGRAGLTLLGPNGEELARTPAASEPSNAHYLTGEPLVLGDHIVVPALHDVRVYDERAELVSTLAPSIRRGSMVRFAGGVLATLADDDEDGRTLVWWELRDGRLVQGWQRTVEKLGHVRIAGDFVVVGSKDGALVIDRAGAVRQRIEVGHFHDARTFDDGVAVIGGGARWWRPEHGVVTLPHDATPGVASTVPCGLATAEGDVVYLWRRDLQGPEPVPLVHDMPLDRPIVVGGRVVILEGAGRFALRGRVPAGVTVSIAPAPWREPTTREEAERIVARLMARSFDESAQLPADATLEELAQLPLGDVVDLHGRALFAPATLDATEVARLAHARSAFFAELSAALGVSARTLTARVRAGTNELAPPRVVDGYEYLGAFTSSGALVIADPCHIEKETGRGLALALSARAEPGTWHAFVRAAASAPGRNAELVTVHERGLEATATTRLGSIGVDAGCAGVFDGELRTRGVPQPYEEGIVLGLGALVRSGYGDGGYPVLVAREAGVVVKARVVFIDDDESKDRFVPHASSTVAKPYRASSEFAEGDVIAHAKFGTGTVVRATPDGKIDVRFGPDTRTLVHKKR